MLLWSNVFAVFLVVFFLFPNIISNCLRSSFFKKKNTKKTHATLVSMLPVNISFSGSLELILRNGN